MSGLLYWFEAREVPAIELHSTAMGEHLYRSLGFSERTGPRALRRREWDLSPDTE